MLNSRLLDLFYTVGEGLELARDSKKRKTSKAGRTTTIFSEASSAGTAEPNAGAPAFLSMKVSLFIARESEVD